MDNNSWMITAFASPALYALVNLIDKNLLSKQFKEGGVGTLILVSAFLSIMAVPIYWYIDPTVLDVGVGDITILGVTAILDVALLWFYLLALKDDEPTTVIMYYQLVPVIGLVLGYFILKESMGSEKLGAAAIVLVGTTIISFQFDAEKGLRFRWKTALLMIAACTCWALGNVLFKDVALVSNLWRSLFWKHVVLAFVGVVLFALIPSYRKHFIVALKKNSGVIISLNVLNEVLYMAGSAASAFAAMLAPVALVQLATTYQAFFVLALGALLTRLSPSIVADKLGRKHLTQNVLAIFVTGVGTYLLLTT